VGGRGFGHCCEVVEATKKQSLKCCVQWSKSVRYSQWTSPLTWVHTWGTVEQIKRWERKDVKPNSLPVVKKLHVKVGDNVKVIGGADKGKISTVTRIYTHNSKVLLKDINLKTKHVKGKAEGEIGQIVQVGLWESFNTTLLHLTAEL